MSHKIGIITSGARALPAYYKPDDYLLKEALSRRGAECELIEPNLQFVRIPETFYHVRETPTENEIKFAVPFSQFAVPLSHFAVPFSHFALPPVAPQQNRRLHCQLTYS